MTNNSETPAAIMATYLMSASRQHSGTENVISCLEELLNHPNGEFGWFREGLASGGGDTSGARELQQVNKAV